MCWVDRVQFAGYADLAYMKERIWMWYCTEYTASLIPWSEESSTELVLRGNV